MIIFMKWLTIGWAVIVGVVEVVLVYSIAQAGNDRFESLVLGSLIVIYVTIKSMAAGLGYIKITESVPEVEYRLRVLRLLKDSEFQADDFKEEISRASEQVAKQKFKLYIDMGVNFVIYIIGLLALFGNA